MTAIDDLIARVSSSQEHVLNFATRRVECPYEAAPLLAKALGMAVAMLRDHAPSAHLHEDRDTGRAFHTCTICYVDWPCDEAETLAEIEALLGEKSEK